ncbi:MULTISPECIES: hypothetical protein [unclassified Mesorhizobium]|uniref:hypothetical protein n=1 Tax=unclassified Mesorhizobium TaxID=325217 RepID=UPI00112A6F24|nr:MULTISPECIES: hypothetical protein [unclassified Mesorhizobium]TPK42629.1 hypothetical protein FJ550_29685 [Mesorhizobium sp. B2-5-2]TPL26749.1 hypothetical protein FJ946_13005 [Mesorhizobium sp. B2-4-7]TPL40527.1 hypothetical protein FJ961_17305 [Mesorhizobium sp. B2-4-5]TPM76801.1 hypothetical protein FJ968_03535 [Mesorhizobium sp. B2-1-6]TPN72464.1 hypothetical protein FJ985_29190 [Mesorhizobium sp. B1-1-2]
MPVTATNQGKETGRRVNVMLTSARVTQAFRDALFQAADEARMTPSDFALLAAAEKLLADGSYEFPGVFHPGDINAHNDNHGQDARRHA